MIMDYVFSEGVERAKFCQRQMKAVYNKCYKLKQTRDTIRKIKWIDTLTWWWGIYFYWYNLFIGRILFFGNVYLLKLFVEGPLKIKWRTHFMNLWTYFPFILFCFFTNSDTSLLSLCDGTQVLKFRLLRKCSGN